MPSTDTLERFIAQDDANEHADAIEAFCNGGASMRENHAPPRVGRDALVDNERRGMARAGFPGVAFTAR